MKNTAVVTIISLLLIQSCNSPENEFREYDICIYGGTSAGVIAAYSAHLLGKSVILIEPGQRIGGLSSGGLGQTDIGNKYAVTGLSKDFYRRLGKEYGTLEQWTFEPGVALKVFTDYINEANIEVLYDHRLNRVYKKNKTIKGVCLEKSSDPASKRTFIKAEQFIDCSYEGDLMARAGVSYTVGRESNDLYKESYNGVQLLDKHQFPDSIDPYIIAGDTASGLLWGISDAKLAKKGSGDKAVQAYNFRICLTDSLENMTPISRPPAYDSSKYELLLRLIEKTGSNSIHNHFIWSPMPNRKTDINNNNGFSTDMIGMNWNYPEASYKKREEIIKEHLNYTLGLLYFIGHDPRIPETMRAQMLRWGLPLDEYQETGHFSPQLYVREARRMLGEYVMTEANCIGEEIVEDAIGLAAYTMDSHNCQRLVVNGMVKNEGDVQIGGFPPYPIAYRSLTPKREECINLLVPVDLSASHIAYGSIRMEPVFMVLGQVSAIAACMAIEHNTSVQQIDVRKLQEILLSNPMLDGTKPEIVIDNSDSLQLEIDNSLELRNKKWEDKAYRSDFLLNNTQKGSRQISFKAIVPEQNSYAIYYYCPNIKSLSEENGIVEQLPIHIQTGKMNHRTKIPFRESAASWAYCGTFDLDTDHEIVLTANASGIDGAFAADAVLLIPQNK